VPDGYDALAWFYARYWGPRFHDAARPVLERLLYRSIAPGDSVLDVCCGTGDLTRELVERGYTVVGMDRSLEMLRIARQRIDGARLVCADAASGALRSGGFAAAVSTFDSINHLMTVDRLEAACRMVAGVLRPHGVFVFDVNTREAYESEWGKTSATVDADAALFVRGSYDPATAVGRTCITVFRRDGAWHRDDVEITQRAFSRDDLTGGLARAGFHDASLIGAADAGMAGDIAVGRLFARAER
jgi:SAM-dependent methyltransferase